MDIYESTFEFTPDALFVIDRRGRIDRINEQGARMFGYVRDELVGRPIEALMNAARHAEASLIEIELAVEDGHVQVSVTDDGIGVSTKRQASGTGMGLRIMDYRASKIAGTLGLEEPGVGTRIIVSAPLSSLIATQTAGVEAGRYGTARGRQPT